MTKSFNIPAIPAIPNKPQQGARLRAWLEWLTHTPLHPQFLANRYTRRRHRIVGTRCVGRVLDIGSGRKPLTKHLPASCDYISLDYPATGAWYETRPAVFGDASRLPFADETFDTVVCLEVLEHLSNPTVALKEAKRVLKASGSLILSTPFLYPIHDAPADYQRWTKYGLKKIARDTGLELSELIPSGGAIESGALMFSLGLAWQTLNASGLVKLVLLAAAVILIPLVNVIGLASTRLKSTHADGRFAIGYLSVMKAYRDEHLSTPVQRQIDKDDDLG